MTLSRWRRVATGIAAGVIVLCAALIGASFRDDTGGVLVASDLRPTNVIPIADDPVADDAVADDAVDDAESTSGDAVTVIEGDDLPDADAGDDTSTTNESGTDADADAGDTTATDTGDTADTAAGETATDETATDSTTAADTGDASDTADTTDTDAAGQTAPETSPEPPLTATDEALGTGGGVDDAECALDRLVIYAGARRGGVAGSLRNALAAAGFAAGCPAPVTVLASNCPLQFAGVLGAGSSYDPMNSFVASSSSVDRETMTAVMAAVGYSGAEINILDFSFVNPDKPGEQWMAIFIPPTFSGWENLAGRAGISPTTSSLCAPSGQLVG